LEREKKDAQKKEIDARRQAAIQKKTEDEKKRREEAEKKRRMEEEKRKKEKADTTLNRSLKMAKSQVCDSVNLRLLGIDDFFYRSRRLRRSPKSEDSHLSWH
jgi:hypothetical protein